MNSLPTDIQSSPSLPVFRQLLKHFFFYNHFLILYVTVLRLRGLRNSSAILATLKILIDSDTDIDKPVQSWDFCDKIVAFLKIKIGDTHCPSIKRHILPVSAVMCRQSVVKVRTERPLSLRKKR